MSLKTAARRARNHDPILVVCGWLFCLTWTLFGAVGLRADEPNLFVDQIRPIFQQHCYECHSGESAKSNLRLDLKAEAMAGGELYGAAVIPGDPDASPLIQFVSDPDADLPMPPAGPALSDDEIQLLRQWVADGALWPDGVDTAAAVDKRDHWSFYPRQVVSPPPVQREDWARNEIDHFILARLEEVGLQPAPEADRPTWLRRVTWDLTGLPPTPEQLRAFVDDTSPGAYERVVQRLLSSPQYGPRWAQHWLDVVRYADTHGFEVNTERPHAWPYRDYVIRAFQDDLPYDQFVRQQITGDLLEQDAATGFLFTSSVLLPGQIGEDEPSKRLARQDALDEVVTNISQSFLALSVGCARCHDHRFDAVSQREYFAMQALVAGVEYADRPWRGAGLPDHQLQRQEASNRLASIVRQLLDLEPLAQPQAWDADDVRDTEPAESAVATAVDSIALASTASGPQRDSVHAGRNVDRFSPVTTDRLRFTILRTNRYEPCLDELEVWDAAGRNLARVDAGLEVTSSGDRVSPGVHELRFINDGVYGNSSSWMCQQHQDGWVQYTWEQPVTMDAVTWGRDRTGQYDDRLAVEYRIEVGVGPDQWQVVADHTDRQPSDQAEASRVASASAPASASAAASSVVPEEMPAEDETDSSADQRQALSKEREALEQQIQTLNQVPLVFGGQFRQPDSTYLLRRGDPEQPLEEVSAATLAIWQPTVLPLEATDPQRRQALADWLTDPQHPLTARVMVNRIWQGHFGTGLVGTPNDFGRNGQPPSHPELLDFLAQHFVDSGWSVKSLHRLIVLSATYRQAGVDQPAARQLDSDITLLWRFPGRRLEAEAIRDGMLWVAGLLDLQQGGPGFDLFQQRGGLTGFTPIESFAGAGWRRMIFAHKVRRERDAVFGAFDCPDGGQSAGIRRISTTPIQALNLLNSRFSVEVARAFAQRIEAEAGDQLEDQIDRAWHWALGRMPDDRERQAAQSVAQEHGLAIVCRALLNSNEFLYLP